MSSAICVGCVTPGDGTSEPLTQFDDEVEIPDGPLDGSVASSLGTDVKLVPFRECKNTASILGNLMVVFKATVPRKGQNDEEWHDSFEKFISALVARRKERVLLWIDFNTAEFANDGDIQKLKLEAVTLLSEVQQNLLLCSCKCEKCFLRCVQEKGHASSHSCTGDHKCAELCTYCLQEESDPGACPCSGLAGHDGHHDCREKSHTCSGRCVFAGKSSNCSGSCSKEAGHFGDHHCSSRQHMCNRNCCLPSCKNPCTIPIDLSEHTDHSCHEKFCPARCSMRGCNRTCATQDHFHRLRPGVKLHSCGSEHRCLENCEHQGNCEILTEVTKKTRTFTGKRSTFDYELVSEQNGNRKACCIVIPPNKERHDGLHSHSTKVDAAHFCETRCQSCGYFCNLPIGHKGLHNTTHGNMREVNFVAESEEIDILERKYMWGESGIAELCQMHCKARRRGHIHLIRCSSSESRAHLMNGRRHETRKYGPDFDVPKDEMTHAAFWEHIGFEDPCSAEEKKQYALCSHQCRSDEHAYANASNAVETIYCTEQLWHDPLSHIYAMFVNGYITNDGHHFNCNHSRNLASNLIFIIDRSASMAKRDITPTMTKFSKSHRHRLGCVYEAIFRFVRTRLAVVQGDVMSVVLFNDQAQTVVCRQEMKENVVDRLTANAEGRTDYAKGLQKAEEILVESLQRSDLRCKSPIVIFLSDGENNGRSNPLDHIVKMKAVDRRLEVHTIMFGNSSCQQILTDMAKAGDGTFEVSRNEVHLNTRFERLAKSLRPKVASLI